MTYADAMELISTNMLGEDPFLEAVDALLGDLPGMLDLGLALGEPFEGGIFNDPTAGFAR